MQQVERGNLDLDADVNNYLNTFKIEDSWPSQPVTMRDIMSHTAGFEDGGRGYLILDDANRIVPLAQSLASHMPARINPPGAHTAYSNWATALAGLIVANVSGIEFNDYVQRNIFDVLQMKNSSFVEPLPPELDRNMAKAYGWQAGKYVEKKYEIVSNFGPAGALAATSHDMALFARAILGGGQLPTADGNVRRILKAVTVKQMLTTLFSHDDRTRGMAHGFIEYPYNGVDIIGHEGSTTIFSSHFGLSLEHNTMLFFSFSGPGGGSVRRTLEGPFYDYFYPSLLNDVQPNSDFADRAANFVGTYQLWRANFTKFEALYNPLSEQQVSAMPDNTLLIGDSRYIEVDKNLFRQVDGERRIVFQENDSGEINGFIEDGLATKQRYKAPFYTTLSFIFFILLVSVVVFIAVLLRRAYQGVIYQALPAKEKTAFRASLMVSSANLIFLLLLWLALATARNMVYELPWLLKFSLIFPILALLATIYHFYQSTLLWRNGFGSVLSRVRFSMVSLCGMLMIWLYNHLNLLGFNYFS